MADLFNTKGAVFNKEGTHRFELWRTWDISLPTLMYIMLNPSTANSETNDPTINTCEAIAAANGFGRILVGNLFSFCASKPKELFKSDDPVGFFNDTYLMSMARQSKQICFAWGAFAKDPRVKRRADEIIKMFPQSKTIPSRIRCIGITKDGHPFHPLFQKYNSILYKY